jgi:hypothetical protein
VKTSDDVPDVPGRGGAMSKELEKVCAGELVHAILTCSSPSRAHGMCVCWVNIWRSAEDREDMLDVLRDKYQMKSAEITRYRDWLVAEELDTSEDVTCLACMYYGAAP